MDVNNIYLLDEIYYQKEMGIYKTRDGKKLSEEEFQQKKNAMLEQYEKFTEQELAYNDLSRKQTWNQIVSMLLMQEEWLGTENENNLENHYNGQDLNAWGYGGIYDCELYLQDRYGVQILTSTGESINDNEKYTLRDLSSTDNNNCTIGAVTRLIAHEGRINIPGFSLSPYVVYPIVKERAIQYGYTPEKGTFPTKINNIIEKSAEDVGRYDVRSKGVYIWNFDSEVVQQINEKKMVVMNITRGYYQNHSVAVVGYKIYTAEVGNSIKEYPMIEIYDGWVEEVRYIDYLDFAFNFKYAGIGSFNTVYYVD